MRVLGATLIVATVFTAVSSASLAESDGLDFTSVMRHAYRMEGYNDSARRQWQRDLQQWGLNAELSRERTLGTGYGPSHPSREVVATMFFRPTARYAYEQLARMAAAGAPRDPQVQKQYRALYMAMIDEFGANSFSTKRFVPAARMAFLQAAYRVFDRDAFSDRIAAQLGMQALIWAMMNSPDFVGKSNLEKQALYERYVVGAGSLSLAYRWAGTSAGSRHRVQLRRLAAEALSKDMGRDPSTVSLDQLPCVVFPMPMLSCQAQLKLMRGGSI